MPAELTLSVDTLFAFLFVLARVGGVLLFVPLPGLRHGPETARMVLAVVLTVALFPIWPRTAAPADAGVLVAWLTAEAAFGVTAGLAVAFLLETLMMAAQLLGFQAGYSFASTIDPTTQADSGVLLVFANLLAGLLFFSLGLDREVLRVFARSLEVYPPGTFAIAAAPAEAILKLGSAMFSTGLRLAMPVVVLLLLVDLALALLGRINQQLQLLTLAFPAKMLASLAMIALVLPVFIPVFHGAAERTFTTLAGLVR